MRLTVTKGLSLIRIPWMLLRTFCRLLSGDNYRVEYTDVLRQWIFTVKRRMLGLFQLSGPIFLEFFTAIKVWANHSSLIALCGPLQKRHQYVKLTDGSKVVENDKYADMLRK